MNNTNSYIFIHSIDTDGPLKPFNLIKSGSQPGTQQPGTEQPGTQQPGTQQPGTQQPGTQQPGTQQPGTQQPGTEQPGTQQPAQPTGDRAILTVTMDNGFDKEFDLSKKELNAFIAWYDAKDAGRGASFFA
ncbi:hypothetical protein WG8_0535, partial [Paenibacillus sp. Aloe-11]